MTNETQSPLKKNKKKNNKNKVKPESTQNQSPAAFNQRSTMSAAESVLVNRWKQVLAPCYLFMMSACRGRWGVWCLNVHRGALIKVAASREQTQTNIKGKCVYETKHSEYEEDTFWKDSQFIGWASK